MEGLFLEFHSKTIVYENVRVVVGGGRGGGGKQSVSWEMCKWQISKDMMYRAHVLTRPAAMQIYCNKRKCLDRKKEFQPPQDWCGMPT